MKLPLVLRNQLATASLFLQTTMTWVFMGVCFVRHMLFFLVLAGACFDFHALWTDGNLDGCPDAIYVVHVLYLLLGSCFALNPLTQYLVEVYFPLHAFPNEYVQRDVRILDATVTTCKNLARALQHAVTSFPRLV
ncbi:Aste57867_12947 [Aphanomyces stellatus]|uniref:Aste57867_12947 protein n=1 Tax=Aphanomyces stellatus TaxID=120398 RepID=A0A485KYI9_9STRA|nr:hypothetical protein As57867_012899 [Aphanomyces stellatus]VFT89793.1 Aste57867_12947 [Aphanomyces stellatus]